MNLYVDLDDKYGVELISKALESRMGLPSDMHVYVKNNLILKWDDLQFGFGKQTSTIFKRDHPFDYDTYAKLSVKDLHEILNNLQNKKIPESEIIRQQFQYFGNNVVNVGKMMERKEWLSDSWSNELRKSAVEDLQSSLSKVGYNRDIQVWLDKKIEQRTPSFSHRDNFEQDSGDKVGCKFHFEMDKENGGYSMPKYELTLFGITPIDHGVINGVDTRQLEERMWAMDWLYGIAETPGGVLKGYSNHEKIEAALVRLSQDEKGAHVAMQLWNNHISPDVLTKPEYIRKEEERTDLYPKATFPGETPLLEASQQLQAAFSQKQPLLSVNDNKVDEHTIHTDVRFDAAGLEKLEERMKLADWFYDYTDDNRVWHKGLAEISGIKTDLEKLCQAPGGGKIANELWDKYVPQLSVSKPDFISKAMRAANNEGQSSNNIQFSSEQPKSDPHTLKTMGKNEISSNAEQSIGRKQRNRRRLE